MTQNKGGIALYYDRVIIGSGIYGMYASIISKKKHGDSCSVLVIDGEDSYFKRGSYINQARLHNGYHYPRSYSTASKSAGYFNRFYEDYKECINDDFEKVYAIAADYSWTNGVQFKQFCDNLNLVCDEIEKKKYFNEFSIDKAFHTVEYSFDAQLLGDKMHEEATSLGVEFSFKTTIESIVKDGKQFCITFMDGRCIYTGYVLNATYAGVNQIHEMMGYDLLPIKYELCEVILCEVSKSIEHVGLTVMDGPFFSVMPFGKTGYHSITTVSRTPHCTSYDTLPPYDCQGKTPRLGHEDGCMHCQHYPPTSFVEMVQIAKKYLREDIEIKYVKSLYTVKPILKASEIDDSRPTIIKQYSSEPHFYTVFSGKINTMYDLDTIL